VEHHRPSQSEFREPAPQHTAPPDPLDQRPSSQEPKPAAHSESSSAGTAPPSAAPNSSGQGKPFVVWSSVPTSGTRDRGRED
jgi:hypothetical protein